MLRQVRGPGWTCRVIRLGSDTIRRLFYCGAYALLLLMIPHPAIAFQLAVRCSAVRHASAWAVRVGL
jgi:hypothetical protein